MERDGTDVQHRGDRSAYEAYLASMDASMRQKVALTAAHLLCEGRIADMGMGSGQGSHALAALYPRLEVVGVDLDPTMVALASERHRLPNLSFRHGDIGSAVFPDGSLDGLLDSSVLHHVTSFGGYRHENAADAIATQVAALRPHGVIVVRDFVDPGPGEVLLDVREDDGVRDAAGGAPDAPVDASGADPRRCSTAALLERFSREFRPLSPAPGFPLAAVTTPGGPALAPGFRRYRLAHKHAVELLLRKDYREHWESEVKEEYTYFTKERFERLFASLGLRILASTPLRNPWIHRHRLVGKCALHDLDGASLDLPPTNYVIVGEKVPPGSGVELVEAAPHPLLGFLQVEHHRDRRTGRVRDLVRRPHATVDVIPWFVLGADLFVLARTSYPRPILGTAERRAASLDGSLAATYVAEPLSVLQTDRPLGQTVEEALDRRAGIAPSRIRALVSGAPFYPSPGGILEEVRPVLVEIEPVFVDGPEENVSGFSTSGRVRAIEARQLLRAAQVGGLPDARLELGVHELLRLLGGSPGPWIGAEIALSREAPPVAHASLASLLARPGRREFERAPSGATAGFLEVRCSLHEELSARGEVVASRALEHVVPRTLSLDTIAVAPLLPGPGGPYLGLDDDDLPAAQAFSGSSALLVAPAWRLPRTVVRRQDALAWIHARLADEHGLETGELWELGGRYAPSPGVTGEMVHPIAVAVRAVRTVPRPLRFVPLSDVVRSGSGLADGHLRVVAHRAAHALGLLG